MYSEWSRYWWDLQLHSCANRYDKVTWDAAMNRVQFHNQSIYKDNLNKFSWEYEDDIIKLLVNGKPIATLQKVGEIENPDSVYRWYRG